MAARRAACPLRSDADNALQEKWKTSDVLDVAPINVDVHHAAISRTGGIFEIDSLEGRVDRRSFPRQTKRCKKGQIVLSGPQACCQYFSSLARPVERIAKGTLATARSSPRETVEFVADFGYHNGRMPSREASPETPVR